jgi:hypothetical protein
MIPALRTRNVAEKAELTILKALAYFDMFSYPLTQEEIRDFMDHYAAEEEFQSAIRQLVFRKLIFKFDEFYSLRSEPALIERRIQGNLRARKLLPKAARIGTFLYKFPFVRAVAVSGSLSKNYADVKEDIDYFIITKQNRLWIARTFLHLFKKFTFLLGRQHFYCMNYFIDEKALLIQEQNIYSATEVVTLLPAAGMHTMNHFFQVNRWVEEWLPVHTAKHETNSSNKTFALKNILESIFNKDFGDRLDDFLFKWTTRRLQTKEQQGLRNLKGRVMNLVTGKHFSKSDPGAFQEKIVRMYEAKVDQLTSRLLNYPD